MRAVYVLWATRPAMWRAVRAVWRSIPGFSAGWLLAVRQSIAHGATLGPYIFEGHKAERIGPKMGPAWVQHLTQM